MSKEISGYSTVVGVSVTDNFYTAIGTVSPIRLMIHTDLTTA